MPILDVATKYWWPPAARRLRRRRVRQCVSPLLIAMMLSGCGSTLKSVDVALAPVGTRKGAYLEYSAAQSLFTVTLSADASALAGGATSGSKLGATTSANPASPPASASATSPPASTTWTLAGTLTQSSSSADSSSSAGGDAKKVSAPTDTSHCAVLTAQYNAVQVQVAAAVQKYVGLQQTLAQIAASALTDQATISKAAADFSSYVDAVNPSPPKPPAYQLMVQNAQAAIYPALASQCLPKVKVQIQQSIVPDRRRTFALIGLHDGFYADQINLKVDSNGFLTTGNPSSQSNIGAIAAAVATDIGEFVVPNPSVAVAEVPGALTSCEALSKTPLAQALKTLKTGKSPGLQDAATKVACFLPDPGALPALPGGTNLPLTVMGRIEDFEADSDHYKKQVKPALFAYGVNLSFSCSPRNLAETAQADPARNATITATSPGGQASYIIESGASAAVASESQSYDGLLVSASRSCEFLVTQNHEVQQVDPNDPTKLILVNNPLVLADQPLWAQDSRFLKVLPTDRGVFTNRAVEYDFANGQATAVNDTRPSEVLAFVQIPSNVVGAFISGVTGAITNKKSVTDAHTAEVTSQTNLLTAQSNLLSAQAALAKAKAQAAEASP